MSIGVPSKGQIVAAEIAEAPDVFAHAALGDHKEMVTRLGFERIKSIYTIARGSGASGAAYAAWKKSEWAA